MDSQTRDRLLRLAFQYASCPAEPQAVLAQIRALARHQGQLAARQQHSLTDVADAVISLRKSIIASALQPRQRGLGHRPPTLDLVWCISTIADEFLASALVAFDQARTSRKPSRSRRSRSPVAASD